MANLTFNKVLIANRGEIACRILRTAKKLGLYSIAIFSEADRNALHVQLADEAHLIGPAPSRESYLNISKIIQVAKESGAQAIHPGYGFLAENAEFAQTCHDNNIIFIGPPASAIAAMGSKSVAKKIMAKAGVPILPGYHGEDQSDATLISQANQIGYPLLIKAAAGGGGKGMRIVWEEAKLVESIAATRREALASFNDDKLLLEKYLQAARHIEVQIFADQHQHFVHLFERDCSLQRRQQKIIEEAPAPLLSQATREKLGLTAIKAGQAVNYIGAGTIEFLVDEKEHFYFMEMNTRLQVEHPVTEMITKQDLVEWQFKVASNQPLPCDQKQLKIHGHAIEARIYAEDPSKQFMPSIGKITKFQKPAENQHVRIDTGIGENNEISRYYDPMIAKLIVWDNTRELAIQQLQKALQEIKIEGVKTNIHFLLKLAADTTYLNAKHTTDFCEKHLTELLAFTPTHSSKTLNSPWEITDGWRLNLPAEQNIINSHSGETHEMHAEITNAFSAPMAGTVVEWLTKPQHKVQKGAGLMVIEAMKMQHTIHAPCDGCVDKFNFKPGELVDEGVQLLSFTNDEAT